MLVLTGRVAGLGAEEIRENLHRSLWFEHKITCGSGGSSAVYFLLPGCSSLCFFLYVMDKFLTFDQ